MDPEPLLPLLYGLSKGTIEPLVANLGNTAVTDLNQSVSNSAALAKDLNSDIPFRSILRMIFESAVCICTRAFLMR